MDNAAVDRAPRLHQGVQFEKTIDSYRRSQNRGKATGVSRQVFEEISKGIKIPAAPVRIGSTGHISNQS